MVFGLTAKADDSPLFSDEMNYSVIFWAENIIAGDEK